jgi:hypothetical protein
MPGRAMDGGIDRRFAERLDLGDIRFHRAIARLHRLGPRVLAELLAEIGAGHLVRQPIERLVDEYLDRLDPVAVAVAGGDRLPPPPIHLVPRRGR